MQKDKGHACDPGTQISSAFRETEHRHRRNFSSKTIFESPIQRYECSNEETGLERNGPVVRGKQAIAGSLDTEPRELEWKKGYIGHALNNNLYQRLQIGIGRSLEGPSSFWLLGEPGSSGSHKHSRTENSKACTREVKPYTGSNNTDLERQYDRSFIYGWNDITPNESTSGRDLDNMSTQTGAFNSRTHTRASECNSRLCFTHENRLTRLVDQQRNIRSDSASVGATEPRCIRQLHKSFNPSIHIMKNGSRSDCYQFSLRAMKGLEYLGQPSMDSITQGAGQGDKRKVNVSNIIFKMAISFLVPGSIITTRRPTLETTEQLRNADRELQSILLDRQMGSLHGSYIRSHLIH